MNLALFDFDGTITEVPTYPDFVRMAIRPGRKLWVGPLLSPLILGYRCGVVSDEYIRKWISRFGFVGEDPARVRQAGEHYARHVLPGMMRPIALERIAWHKAQGDRVVVVSASLDAYLEPWCRSIGVEVICTTIEIKNGRMTGRYLEGDCTRDEKSRRILQRYTLDDYEIIYAYGDREDDREMLNLASRRFFCWQEES